MQEKPIKGTTDWRKYELVVDVPNDSAGVFYGLLLIGGRGKAWIDDVVLETVDDSVPTTRITKFSHEAVSVPDHPTNLGFENGFQLREDPVRGTEGFFEGA